MSGTQGSNIRSAVDLAAWNRDHSDIALPKEYPNQALIEGSIAFDATSDKRRACMDHVLKVGKSFADALEKYAINVIIAPGDGKFSLFSAATGKFIHCQISFVNFFISYMHCRVSSLLLASWLH
jgi:uncharacterized ubiquitin-like protein YukD